MSSLGITEASGWTLAPGMLRELRLKKAEDAIAAGDPDLATVEAEELLDEEPDHIDALLIVGEASLDTGLAECAASAYRRVLALVENHPRALSGLCITHFELGDLEGCVAIAEASAEVHPELVGPWYYRGLALERLERPEEAAAPLARAAALAPELYPLLTPLSDAEWDVEVAAGLAALPERLRAWVDPIPWVVCVFPDIAALRAIDPTATPTIPASFDGEAPELSEGDVIPWDKRPTAIRLYRGNLERIAGTEDVSVARLVTESIRLEALDWLGLPLDAMELPEPPTSS